MKNYYKILGVIPTAEMIVIKAAYRALSQKYHPDKNRDEAEKYQQKMQDLNEAYSVLSDEIKKKEYDQEFFSDELDDFDDDLFQDQDGQDMQFENDWNEITEYFPDLNDITNQLAKISSRLVSTFKYHLHETKDFDNRQLIAQLIEINYLQKYFGTNETILKFAKILVLCRFTNAAKKLNRAVNLLGSNSDPKTVIDRIKQTELNPEQKLLTLLVEKGLMKSNIRQTIKICLENLERKIISPNTFFSRSFDLTLVIDENLIRPKYDLRSENKSIFLFESKESIEKLIEKLVNIFL
jgi:curved DNA-binding protein CbpA